MWLCRTRPPLRNPTLLNDILFEWAYFGSNKDVVAVLIEGGKLAGFHVSERLFDRKKWFRQIGTSEEEFWKAYVFVVGAFVSTRERTQMGRGSRAHDGW